MNTLKTMPDRNKTKNEILFF